MRIGIDLGGTKIEAVALGNDGATLLRKRVQTPPGGYDQVLDTITTLVGDLERETGQRGTVGIGTPGTISARTGLVKNANTVYLIGQNIAVDLGRRLNREVRLENDANCFALSEAIDGSGAGFNIVLGVILGTGVGAGLVIDKRVIRGANGIAGEWGHNPLPWASSEESSVARCYCGKYGCIESFLSGSGLQRAFRVRSGRYVSTYEIARAAAGHEPDAVACLAEYDDRLARSLATVINVVDPHVIVLGGGLSQIERDYQALHAAIAAYALTDQLDTRVVPAQHGDASGVRGAAALWPISDP
jgi:fructokinase